MSLGNSTPIICPLNPIGPMAFNASQVLLLDECTSALDPQSQAAAQKSLESDAAGGCGPGGGGGGSFQGSFKGFL